MSHAAQIRPAAPPPRRSLAAVLLGVGLAVLSMVLLPGQGVAHAAEIRSGYADWGIRESFRNYLQGPIAHGDVTVSEGAEENADGSFRFPVVGGSFEADAGTVEARAEGKVRLRGHRNASGEYELWMTVANPRIVIGGDAGTLYADVVSRDKESGQERRYPGVGLADLDPRDADDGAWTDVPAVLTEEGAPAFGGFYSAGDELDPVTLVVRGEQEPAGGGDAGGGGASAPALLPRRPLVKRLGGRTRPVTRNGVASLALVGCRPPRPCLLRTPRFAAVKVGLRAFRARVLAPRAVKAGGWASVRLWLPPRPRRLLAARHGRVTVPVVARSGGQRVVRRLGALLRSVPARGGRGRAAR